MEQNYINHICLTLDASSSMYKHINSVVKVADNQIAYLAQRSKELDQETRITLYAFNSVDGTKCLIYDKDVLRMPKIGSLYKPTGMTPLIDATLLSINDLKLTPEKYGEHAFLIYVLTDGLENASRNKAAKLSTTIAGLPDHWTLGTFVPDQTGVFEAKKHGFLPENISVWDATSSAGIAEVETIIRETSEQFMQNRKVGIRGTKSLFSLNKVTATDITKQLTPLAHNQYWIFPVAADSRIDDFVVSRTGQYYTVGSGFYQLTKKETIQPQKKIAILHMGKVYVGQKARDMLGLPNYNVQVKPEDHTNYTIFVQSTSINRKLIAGTNLLVLK